MFVQMAKEAAKREREEQRQREIDEAKRIEAEKAEEEKRKVPFDSIACVQVVLTIAMFVACDYD